MKSIVLIAIGSFFSLTAAAQEVPQKVIVEHFTNSRCGVCASRNPGFYTNLNAQPNVLHLSIHPSSPYSTCVFNQHNVADNDARTNYYGVYGGTPRLVIQGTVLAASANYANSSIFTPYLNRTSPVSIRLLQQKMGTDSIISTVIIKTVAPNTLPAQKLFLGLAEKTVDYNAPNGETVHHDVFRKALTSATGMSVGLPAVGDSLVMRFASANNAAWNFQNIYAVAILQTESTKSVTQAEATTPSQNDVLVTTTSAHNALFPVRLFPNPSAGEFVVELPNENPATLTIYNANGTNVAEWTLLRKTTNLSLTAYPKGLYLLQIRHAEGVSNHKLMIQ